MFARAAAVVVLLCAGCGDGGGESDGPLPGGDGGGGGDMGGCMPACGGLTPFCNASHHCVGCRSDADCAVGTVCTVVSDSMASCTPGCADDTRCGGSKCCAMHCVDTTSDPSNCGGCGMPCTGAHASASCTAGKCSAGTCDPGWGDCNNDPKDGCEANLSVDPANCQGCGMACALPNAISACADGCYIAACQFGYDDCDAMTGNGCETSVLGDPSNCGACGRSCAGIPNASASCTDGNCVLGACNAGYANCDGDPNNGCEVNLTFDAKNCGGCNMPCGNMMTCNSGVCGAPPKVKRIFVSSMQYTGNLGGLTGADAKCQGLADAVALGGSYKAWLSDDMGNSPSTRFNRATVNYVLVDGTTVVATGWTGLASGTLQHAINLNEKGGPPPLGNTNCAGGGFLTVWTSTMANGTAFGNNDSCAGWTGGNGGSEWGRADVVDGTWTSWCNGGLCTWTSPIYCVEQ